MKVTQGTLKKLNSVAREEGFWNFADVMCCIAIILMYANAEFEGTPNIMTPAEREEFADIFWNNFCSDEKPAPDHYAIVASLEYIKERSYNDFKSNLQNESTADDFRSAIWERSGFVK